MTIYTFLLISLIFFLLLLIWALIKDWLDTKRVSRVFLRKLQ